MPRPGFCYCHMMVKKRWPRTGKFQKSCRWLVHMGAWACNAYCTEVLCSTCEDVFKFDVTRCC